MDPEPSGEDINELRQLALSKIETLGEDAVDPKDLQRLKKDDDWLRRFLKHNDSKQKESFQMLWNVLQWRKDNDVNGISEDNVYMDILISGGFFPRGKDIDGCTILIFKCKQYVKNQYESEVVKRCVIYWMERLERQTKGKAITLFFDMEKCGLANMDLDFTQYLIGLFKDYYPYFLNYVIVFEMPWILSAAFKVIKSWLPEKAVKKIKFVGRSDLHKFVPKDQALTCWGGEDDFVFRFESEEKFEETPGNNNKKDNVSRAISPIISSRPDDGGNSPRNVVLRNKNQDEILHSVPKFDVECIKLLQKQVRFHDATQMSDVGSSILASEGDGALVRVVSPEGLLKFIKDADNDFVCNLVLQNIANTFISYKVKTTTPEKFRVRPGIGILAPGASVTINISVLAAYRTTIVSKDKFLILSIPVEQDLSSDLLQQTWRNTTVPKDNQIHLRCAPMGDVLKNGSAPHAASEVDTNLGKVTAKILDIQQNQLKLNQSIKSLMHIQISLLVLLLAAILYVITSKSNQQYLAPNTDEV